MKSAIGSNERGNSSSAMGATLANSTSRPQLDSGAYRDPQMGARARRDKLANKRYQELALIPLTAGRVFVHRVSRIAAGVAVMFTTLVTILIFADPLILNLSSYGIFSGWKPSLPLIIICSMGVILAVYIVTGFIAERVFESRMHHSVEAGGDVFAAIEHLGQSPIDEMQRLVRQVEGASISVPLVGIVMCVPLFAFIATISTSQFTGLFFHPKGYLQPWLLDCLGAIMVAMLVGTSLAIMLGRACQRSHRTVTSPRLLKVMSHYSMLPISIMSGLIVWACITRIAHHGPPVSIATQGFFAIAGTVSVFGLFSWLMLVVRNLENKNLQANRNRSV